MLAYYLRLALTGLRRTPWLAALMVLSLAVGVAASMTTITLRHALSLDPIPDASARLFNLRDPASSLRGRVFSYADAMTLARLDGARIQSVLSGTGVTTAVAAAGRHRVLRGGLGIRYATASFFSVFEVPLRQGRVWSSEEERAAAPVAVLDEGMAHYLFGSASAVGRQIRLDDVAYTVIGVTAPWNPQPRYYDLDGVAGAFGGGGDGVFVPLTAMRYAPDDLMVSRVCPVDQASLARPSGLMDSRCQWLSVWYLAATRKEAKGFSDELPASLARILPVDEARRLRLLDVQQLLAKAGVVPSSVRVYAWLGLAFLALCLLNAAGMQLSRVLRTASQVGIRRALGASRAQIVGQHLCDGLLIGSIGGTLGAGLTFAALAAVRRLPDVYYADLARMDGTMLLAMLGLVLANGALVGVVPAWLASRIDPAY